MRGRKRKTSEEKLKGRKKKIKGGGKGKDEEQMKTHLCVPRELTEMWKSSPRGERRSDRGEKTT